MRRTGFTLIELLVVIAIIAVLLGLLLTAVQQVRAAAARATCQNNLKQLGLAAHAYHNTYKVFPYGVGPAPGEGTALVFLLPFVEQQARFQQFDFSKHLTNHEDNSPARIRDVALYLCPADNSSGAYPDLNPGAGQPAQPLGRSNYFGNMGTNAWVHNQRGTKSKDPASRGTFAYLDRTRMADIVDGTSSTVLFAEGKRGSYPANGPLDITLVAPGDWGGSSFDPLTDPNNRTPPPACANPMTTYAFTGLQFQRGFFITALYTHTIPPNYVGRDCMRLPLLDQGHLAARSYHAGGVNACFADGSVRFVGDNISMPLWQAIGTRAGNDLGVTLDF